MARGSRKAFVIVAGTLIIPGFGGCASSGLVVLQHRDAGKLTTLSGDDRNDYFIQGPNGTLVTASSIDAKEGAALAAGIILRRGADDNFDRTDITGAYKLEKGRDFGLIRNPAKDKLIPIAAAAPVEAEAAAPVAAPHEPMQLVTPPTPVAQPPVTAMRPGSECRDVVIMEKTTGQKADASVCVPN